MSDPIDDIVLEQDAGAKIKGRRLTPNEISQIKRKLGIRNDRPFPLCPARNLSKAKRLNESGRGSHMDVGHRCDECGCTKIAGFGTEHFGYGFCVHHEKGTRKSIAKDFAERHLIALQQKNPAIMVHGEAYMKDVAADAAVANNEFRIAPAAAKVYNMLDGFYSLMSRWESDKPARDAAVEELSQLKAELMARGSADQELQEQIIDSLEAITFKLRFPMTERGGREMSTEVRFKLISSTLKDVMGAMKLMHDITNVNAITVERFKVWLHRLHKNSISEFGQQSYVDEAGQTKRIMDGLVAVFATTGEPSK